MPARLPIRINDDLLRKLWPSGLPDKIIAERMGHGRGSLYRRAKQLGLGSRRLVRSQEAQRDLGATR